MGSNNDAPRGAELKMKCPPDQGGHKEESVNTINMYENLEKSSEDSQNKTSNEVLLLHCIDENAVAAKRWSPNNVQKAEIGKFFQHVTTHGINNINDFAFSYRAILDFLLSYN